MRELTWTGEDGAEALAELARKARLAIGRSAIQPARPDGATRFAELEQAADGLGLAAERVHVSAREIGHFLASAGPALVAVGGDPPDRWLAVAGTRYGRVALLTPRGALARRRIAVVAGWLADRVDAPPLPGRRIVAAWAEAHLRRPQRILDALEHEHRGHHSELHAWLLAEPIGTDFWRQARRRRLLAGLVQFVVVYAVSYALFMLSWWFLGRAALTGRVEGGWLSLWAVTLLVLIPVRIWSVWARARVAVGAGALIKRFLLVAVQRLELDATRREGAGGLLGRVLEAEEIQGKTLDGGFLAVVGLIQLVLSGVVLAQGAAPVAHSLALVGWSALAALLGHHFFTSQARWAALRIEQTQVLSERMLGYRTRLAQETAAERHRDEPEPIERYRLAAGRMDRLKAWLLALVPRGWMVVGLAVLVPEMSASDGGGVSLRLAISVGGVVAAFRGFAKLAEGFGHLSGAGVAWLQVRDLLAATAAGEGPAPSLQPAAFGASTLELTGVTYRHAGRLHPTLEDVSLEVRNGDRILVRGRSGSGKSTLAAVCAGLRRPDGGLLLFRGLDPATVGRGWRRRMVLVPQFHENHVFCETLAFNLLMGRRWPPEGDDLERATEVCRELGLGGLLERMPAGLHQIVGETGWRLSHGESARVCLGRALLQEGDVVILDESFDSLDPETLETALACARSRAPSLVFMAHP